MYALAKFSHKKKLPCGSHHSPRESISRAFQFQERPAEGLSFFFFYNNFIFNLLIFHDLIGLPSDVRIVPEIYCCLMLTIYIFYSYLSNISFIGFHFSLA